MMLDIDYFGMITKWHLQCVKNSIGFPFSTLFQVDEVRDPMTIVDSGEKSKPKPSEVRK